MSDEAKEGFKKFEDMTEEELEQAEKLKGVARCKACEDMVELVEKEMGGISKGMKGAMKEVRAIEIMEKACDKAEQRFYCEEAVEKLEDELIKYIKKGKKKKDYAEDVCTPICSWKSTVKNSISDLNTNFVESIKQQEIQKRLAEIKLETEAEAARLAARPFSERIYDELLLIKQDLDGYWLLISLGMAVFFIFMVTIQVWCLLRNHKKQLEALRRKHAEEVMAKKKK